MQNRWVIIYGAALHFQNDKFNRKSIVSLIRYNEWYTIDKLWERKGQDLYVRNAECRFIGGMISLRLEHFLNIRRAVVNKKHHPGPETVRDDVPTIVYLSRQSVFLSDCLLSPFRPCLWLPPGISIYHNQDTYNQKRISCVDIDRILSQAPHKGTNSHNHGADQRA